MRRLSHIKRALALFCAAALLFLLLPAAFAASGGPEEIDLSAKGLRIGVATGTVQERLVRQHCPDAQIFYFEKVDGCAALAQGKIDCYLYDKRQLEITVANGQSGVRVLEQPIWDRVSIALGISGVSKIPELPERVNAFIAAIRADGTLDEMYERWVVRGETAMPEIAPAADPEWQLRVGTSGIVEPYSYYAGTELTGFDIELIYRLAAWMNAEVSFEIFDYGSIVAAAHSGKVDLIAANLQVTPERAEALLFSEPLYFEQTGVAVRQTAPAEPASAAHAWQAYNGKRLGVLVGPLMEDAAAEYFPDSEHLLFNSYPDCITALLSGRIDAFLGDEPGMKSLHYARPEIDYIHDNITNNNYAFAFRRNDPESQALCEELNAFLARCRQDGTLEELEEIWFGTDEERQVVDMTDLTGENGTIRVVTTSTDMPFSYIKNGQNVGYDIDLVVRFCRAGGYALELGDVDFSGRIPAVQSGKYDFSTDMNVTPERSEQVLFSDPTSHGGIVLAVLASPASEAASGDGVYTRLSELDGRRIGVQTGTSFDGMVQELLPNAQILYFNTKADLTNALTTNKIDAYAVDEPVIRAMMSQNPLLTYVPEYMDSFDFAYVFPMTAEGEALRDQFDAFLRTLRADGTLEQLEALWLSEGDEGKALPDYSTLPAVNGTLRMATEALYEPFTYILNGQIVGYDIDIVIRFCEAYGYGLEIEDMSFDAVLPAVQTGKCDFGGAGITVTPERAESVLFSEPNYSGGTVLAVLKADGGSSSAASFLESLRLSFEKTFLREGRWKMFAQGVGTTLLITLLSILFGTALGFGVFMLCRNGNRLANAVTRFCIWLVQGMPMVVLLMILFYIVFGHVAISGVLVAVIGFTLTFGAAVFGLLKMGVGTVDKGQYEAAYALGHSNRRTFYRIILPQAIPHVLPAYQGEVVSLIKATAIVGYIAVQDLTKMGDIVRSRTYEAFFPLIAVTVIYFVLEGLLNLLLGTLRRRIDPKKRPAARILRGIRTDGPSARIRKGEQDG